MCRRQKKLTEYEKWEYKQLMMSGVLDVREFPLFDEENGLGVLAQVDEVRQLHCRDEACIVCAPSRRAAGASALITVRQPSCVQLPT
jgi:hypothetical protein